MSGTGQKEQEQMDIQDKTKKTGTESIKNRTYEIGINDRSKKNQ